MPSYFLGIGPFLGLSGVWRVRPFMGSVSARSHVANIGNKTPSAHKLWSGSNGDLRESGPFGNPRSAIEKKTLPVHHPSLQARASSFRDTHLLRKSLLFPLPIIFSCKATSHFKLIPVSLQEPTGTQNPWEGALTAAGGRLRRDLCEWPLGNRKEEKP